MADEHINKDAKMEQELLGKAIDEFSKSIERNDLNNASIFH
jgi:hypothetical protein